MSQLNRYFFYTLVFVVVMAAMLLHNYALIGITVLAAIALGFVTEFYDNRRDEAFKHHNANHQYKH